MGPYPEGEERNGKVNRLICTALKNHKRVLVHDFNPGFPPQPPLHHTSLKHDKELNIFFLPGIETIVTMGDGLPLPDECPEDTSEDKFNYLKTIFTKHNTFTERIGSSSPQVFIGGYSDKCLFNAVVYINEFVRNPGEQFYFIPDLCVPFDHSDGKEIVGCLKKIQCNPLTLDEALRMIEIV